MILVTGSTGQLGHAILTRLRDLGVAAEGSSRSGADASRTIDFDDPASISFPGVDTLVLVSAGEAEDDVVVARHGAAIAAAERDGVSHIVYTSVTGGVAGGGDHLAFALAHRWTERRLAAGILPFTILRNGLYADLFGALLPWSGGQLTSAFGEGALSAVTRGDLADAAARVAADPEHHAGQTYDLVGTPLTARQVADRIGAPLVDVSLEHRRRDLDAAGMKPFQPAMLLSIHSAVRHGFLDGTSGDLALLLGRAPSDALAVAAGVAAAGAPPTGGEGRPTSR